MNKELYNKRWKCFRDVLKKERKYQKISQKVLAKKLCVEQSYISKTEIGDRRIDVIELLELCDMMGLSLTDFVFRMEGRLLAEGLLSPERKKDYSRWMTIYEEYHKKSDIQTDAGRVKIPKKRKIISDESKEYLSSCTHITFSSDDMPELNIPLINV